MNKKYKITIVVVLAIILGSVGIYKINELNKKIEVSLVLEHNLANMVNDDIIAGNVIESSKQIIRKDSGQKIDTIFVKENDKVNKGDKLLAYDLESIRIAYEIKKLDLEGISTKMNGIKIALEQLLNNRPIPPKKARLEAINSAENNIDETHPKRFVLIDGDYIKAKELKQLKYPFISIELRDENNNLIVKKVFNQHHITEMSDEETIFIGNNYQENDDPNKNIIQKQRELKKELADLKVAYKRAELEVKDLDNSLEDGVVYAKNDGVIRNVNKDNVLELHYGSGTVVQARLSEYQFKQFKVKQKVRVISLENQNEYEAIITKIDNFPVKDEGFNNNVSYYTFTAGIDQDVNLLELSPVEIRPIEENDHKIYLENAYIRSDEGGSYVLKDRDGKLVKQYVEIGKSTSIFATEILSGLSEEDYIAFPYGDAKEGLKTKISDDEFKEDIKDVR